MGAQGALGPPGLQGRVGEQGQSGDVGMQVRNATAMPYITQFLTRASFLGDCRSKRASRIKRKQGTNGLELLWFLFLDSWTLSLQQGYEGTKGFRGSPGVDGIAVMHLLLYSFTFQKGPIRFPSTLFVSCRVHQDTPDEGEEEERKETKWLYGHSLNTFFLHSLLFVGRKGLCSSQRGARWTGHTRNYCKLCRESCQWYEEDAPVRWMKLLLNNIWQRRLISVLGI